jgi:hypothetical protein
MPIPKAYVLPASPKIHRLPNLVASGRIVAATMATLNNSETREPTMKKIQASSPSKQNTTFTSPFLY